MTRDYEHDPATCEVCQANGIMTLPLPVGHVSLFSNVDVQRVHRGEPPPDRLVPPRAVPPNPGWLCVKCGRSYAPFVMDCVVCNAQVQP